MGLLSHNFFSKCGNVYKGVNTSVYTMREFNDSRVNYLWSVFLYVSLFFLLLFLMYGFKSVNQEMCTSNNLNNNKGVNTLSLIDNRTISFPIDIPNNKDQNIGTETLCVEMVGSTSTYNVVSHNGFNVGVNNVTTGFSCWDNATRTNSFYYSFSCNDCNSTNNVSVSLSNSNALVINNDVLGMTNNVYYRLSLREYCNELFKVFMNVYFAIIGLFVFLFLLIRGLEWFKRWIFW